MNNKGTTIKTKVTISNRTGDDVSKIEEGDTVKVTYKLNGLEDGEGIVKNIGVDDVHDQLEITLDNGRTYTTADYIFKIVKKGSNKIAQGDIQPDRWWDNTSPQDRVDFLEAFGYDEELAMEPYNEVIQDVENSEEFEEDLDNFVNLMEGTASKKKAQIPDEIDFRGEPDLPISFGNGSTVYDELNSMDADQWEGYVDDMAASGITVEYDEQNDCYVVSGGVGVEGSMKNAHRFEVWERSVQPSEDVSEQPETFINDYTTEDEARKAIQDAQKENPGIALYIKDMETGQEITASNKKQSAIIKWGFQRGDAVRIEGDPAGRYYGMVGLVYKIRDDGFVGVDLRDGTYVERFEEDLVPLPKEDYEKAKAGKKADLLQVDYEDFVNSFGHIKVGEKVLLSLKEGREFIVKGAYNGKVMLEKIV